MAAAAKLFSLLLCWGGMVLAVSRRRSGRGAGAATAAAAGFVVGVIAENLLISSLKGDLPFRMIRTIGGGGLLMLWGVSVASLYRSGGGRFLPVNPLPNLEKTALLLGAGAAGLLAGAISLCRLVPQAGGAVATLPVLLLCLAASALAVAASFLAKRLPAESADGGGVAALLVSGLLFMACSLPRLDLFAPLSMDVMKFLHDFVHQFFESMLIPDHPFFRTDVWEYIGLLFSDKVGLWGGMLIWLTPVLLVALAVRLERLPSVGHIRQGAQRRKLLASFIRERRLRQLLPLFAFLLLCGAVYRSKNPSVEYWDPKPLAVASSPAGEILIPVKGEVDLEDGKLHKYLYRQGGREARFFVLMTPSGRITVDLDACSICKPDGYGQSGDSVVCYYCRTLIPIDTVGKVGGCNPVPVSFVNKGAAVSIDGGTLLNTWEQTVQATTRTKGGGR